MMVTSFRKKCAMLIASFALAFVPMVAVPVAVHADQADINTNLKCGSNLATDNSNGCTTQTGTQKINDIITTVINIFSAVVGIVSVIMIIFGGFKYITSGGESSNVSGAKNTILYAIIGLVVVALAQFIVQFVLGKVAP